MSNLTSSEQAIYNQFVAYIQKQGGKYKDWYAGVASDVKKRLFTDHRVQEKNACWIYDNCPSDTAARNIETALLSLGCDGGEGGGDKSSTYVYAYLKTSQTNP